MENQVFDVAIVGMGMAGTFAAMTLAKSKKKLKIITFESGAGPSKRRHQMSGYFGLFPNSDGKLHQNDINTLSSLIGKASAKTSLKSFNSILLKVNTNKIIKDNGPSQSVLNRIKKNNFKMELNNYIQTIPKEVHALSKISNKIIEESGMFTHRYFTDIETIDKDKKIFKLVDDMGEEFFAKKVILAAGRCGWRWTAGIYKHFNIISQNDYGKYGIRVEAPVNNLKDFNKSSCKLTKKMKGYDYEISSMMWNGQIIPEDHSDTAITSYRSNENRWQTDKVSFDLIVNKHIPGKAFEEIDRLGKLTFILTNDRLLKERLGMLSNKKSKISILPEYDVFKEILEDILTIMPDINYKSYFYAPTLVTVPPKVELNKDLQTKITGLYSIGECTGEQGLLFAALSGIHAASKLG